jgi:hypothetical protein
LYEEEKRRTNALLFKFFSKLLGSYLGFFHGNGSMIQDFSISGVVDLLAQRNRVLCFDRPGFGHSQHLDSKHPGRPVCKSSETDRRSIHGSCPTSLGDTLHWREVRPPRLSKD